MFFAPTAVALNPPPGEESRSPVVDLETKRGLAEESVVALLAELWDAVQC